jgi:hypothetical protein
MAECDLDRFIWEQNFAAERRDKDNVDLQERIAMRREAGFSEADAERLAKEDMEKWRKS